MTAPAPQSPSKSEGTISGGCAIIALVTFALFLFPFAARLGWGLAAHLLYR